jgi:xylulokinase
LYNVLEGFYNISSSHHHGHFTRAIMESTAASLIQLVDKLAGNERPKRIVATGGGAKSDLWLQIKADLLGIEFVTTQKQVPACTGAAMLASLAAGWYSDVKTVTQEWVKIKKTFRPIPENHEKYVAWYENMKLV